MLRFARWSSTSSLVQLSSSIFVSLALGAAAAACSAPPDTPDEAPAPELGAQVASPVASVSATSIANVPSVIPWWDLFAFNPATSVVTQHNDTRRSGANLHETTLTPDNVNGETFGRLYTRNVNGLIRAQPLYASQMMVDGVRKNVLLVATSEGWVYAFDAGNTSTDPNAAVLWSQHFLLAPASPHDVCAEIPGNIGITATPVLDPVSNTLYLVTKGKVVSSDAEGEFYVWAVNAATGATLQSAKIPAVSANGVTFKPNAHNARPGLLLQNGHLYAAFATRDCDQDTYQGWVMSFDVTNLAATPGAFATADSHNGSGVWQSGKGLVGDGSGNVYFETGNGTIAPNNYSESFLKLHQGAGNTLTFVGSVVAENAAALNAGDTDLASGGPMLIPGTNRLVGGGKDGSLYVIDSTAFSGIQQAPSGTLQVFNGTDDSYGDCLRGEYPLSETAGPNIHGGPIFWKNKPDRGLLYLWGEKDHLKAYRYQFSTGLMDTTTSAAGLLAAPRKSMPGGFFSLSANGQTDGIVWASIEKTNAMQDYYASGRLIAYDATDLHELWRDDAQVRFAKFTAPTVADGLVFRPTFDNQIIVYGPKTAPAGSAGWPTLGGPADTLYIGGYGQFATGPGGGNIYRNDSSNPDAWTLVGGPGATFAVNDVGLYGLSPAKDGIYAFNGTPQAWTWIGGAAGDLIAGGHALYSTPADKSAILWYDYLTEDTRGATCGWGPQNGKTATWKQVGGPGKQWVATRTTLYGLTPDGSAVYEYSGTPNVWWQIGGPATKLFAGGDTLYATSPTTGNIVKYNGTPGSWTVIGGPGYDFAANSATIYGLSPDRSALYRYNGSGWTFVHGPATAVFAGGDHVAVVETGTGNLREWIAR